MNKKAYISPVTEVTRLMIGHPLCIGSTGSENPTEGLDDDDDPLTNGGDNPSSFSRRGRNQWDDEEDEEDHHGSSRGGW